MGIKEETAGRLGPSSVWSRCCDCGPQPTSLSGAVSEPCFLMGAPRSPAPAPSGSQNGAPLAVAMKESPAAPGHVPHISHPPKSDPVSC